MGTVLLFIVSIAYVVLTAMIDNIIPNINELEALILQEGIGLFLVLFIIASMSLSI